MKRNLINLMIILAFLIGISGCNSDKQSDSDSDANETKELPTIKLVVNAWLASELNVAVAQIILEKEMGYPVEIIPMDESSQWDALASGEVHASLEVWPSGFAAETQRYIEEEKTVEHGGELGPIGKIGWYIPAYLLQTYPELATWEGFKDADNIALFKTPETGDRGRFLAGDPTWVQYDADIIRNLGLNLEVVSLGTEDALLSALNEAYEKQEPILLYFWTPHWAYILYDLVPVELPPYSEECYAREAGGGIDCDYPEEPLFKIFWPGLKDYAPEAYQFLKNFNYTNRDQIAMMAMVHIDEYSAQKAAQTWIDEHSSVWRSWIPETAE